ncbi:RimJ/RimL family protein N-acetyltransferase [Pararhizobium capsulatum DSM 1112]|uniref:RimJ/RimL family protein N-acetyltransferase n=1 Tax=Pararhizobium capsulatum DSM 1112 TaxID=1121113 RepID=A0ABU0BT37_9HYPH|nr:GNAT family N-acetyltransferase [Pararhizobium capsulatum]MDQ0320826.1 RimJ/RimL family protein N-acetyltransferase [Pararhizobium capsulatum DSM 1112]
MIAETERLLIRNWRDTPQDRALFHEINSDPEVMAFFPRQRTRAECGPLLEEARRRIEETGLGFFALALREGDQPIGFCGLNQPDREPILPAGTVEIGWRLARPHWGKGYMTEAGNALLRHGFLELGLPEIVSFAVAQNERSTAVMRRLGMHHDTARDFDHPRVPDTSPDLKRHVLYALTANEWRTQQLRAR